MKEKIKKAFLEELIKKIISIQGMHGILSLTQHVESILREQNRLAYQPIGPYFSAQSAIIRLNVELKSSKNIDLFFKEEKAHRDFEFGHKKKKNKRWQ